MAKQRYLLCLSLIIFSLVSTAQVNELLFQHLTRSNGLPVNGVRCFAQDSSGFIWIGTEEGLYRYDGFNFKAYYAQPGKANSIKSNWVNSICVTRKGLIWLATIGGGAVLMNSNGKVLKLFNSSTNPLFLEKSDWSNVVSEDRQGNIWLATADGLFRISAGGMQVERFDLTKIQSTNSFSTFFFDLNDNIWLAGSTGLVVFDAARSVFKDPSAFPHCCTEIRNTRYLMNNIALHGNELWYSSWMPDLGVFDTSKNIHTIIYSGKGVAKPDYSRIATVFYTDSRNAFWIGTLNGLYVSKAGSGKISASFFHESENPNSIIDNRVRAILEDRDGNFWFGTENGISIARPYSQWIRNISVNSGTQYAFGNKPVNDIIEVDSNSILIGTYQADGLYLTDRNFNVKKHFSLETLYDWIWTHYDDKIRGQVLISTQLGMMVYDKRTKELKIEDRGLFKNRYPVSSFVAISDSVLWLSRFSNSFAWLNLNSGNYKEYDIRNLGEKHHNLLIDKDRDNNIWLVPSGASPLRFDAQAEKIAQRFPMNDSLQALRNDGIYFFKDLDEYFMFGYQLNGITLYHKKTKTYEHFSKADGLPSNEMRAAVVAKDGTAWIATLNGIIHFDPRTKKFKSYGFEDGILSNSFECITQLSDGRIVAGSAKGLAIFHPWQIEKLNKPPLPPVFVDINVYGKDIFIDSLFEANKPLYVSYKKNYFSIEFISLQYNSSRHLEYAYMLEGLDRDWISTGNRRFVSYNNLEGGRYNFRVRVREQGGDWIEAKRSLPVYVQTVFYKQGWFYVLCALTIAAIVYGIFRYRVQQLLKLEKMRTVISSDLHDEIGSSLTSISIFSEMAIKKMDDGMAKEEYIKRIGTRSRESIEKMSDIVWSIHPENDSLEKILVRMKNYSMESGEAKDIHIIWNEQGDLTRLKLSMEQRKNFYLLFKEVINNAVKHSKAKTIHIDLNATHHLVRLTITDDGTGFDTHAITSGNGLKNIRLRAASLKGEIKIESANGKGTSVQIQF